MHVHHIQLQHKTAKQWNYFGKWFQHGKIVTGQISKFQNIRSITLSVCHLYRDGIREPPVKLTISSSLSGNVAWQYHFHFTWQSFNFMVIPLKTLNTTIDASRPYQLHVPLLKNTNYQIQNTQHVWDELWLHFKVSDCGRASNNESIMWDARVPSYCFKQQQFSSTKQ